MKINEYVVDEDSYSFPSIAFLAYDEYDYNDDKYTISATSLLKSDRELVSRFRGEKPVTSKPTSLHDFTKMRIGTSIHSQIEKLLNDKEYLQTLSKENVNIPKQIITEVRSTRKLDDLLNQFSVTGKFDLLIDGKLHDIKTTSTYSYTSGCNDEYYKQQGSIYRWLNQELVTEDVIRIIFIFTDWKRALAETQEGYPKTPIIEKEYQLYSLELTESLIKNKLATLASHIENNTPTYQIKCCDIDKVYPNVKYALYKSIEDATNGKKASKVFKDYEELLINKEDLLDKYEQAVVVKRYGIPYCCKYCELEYQENKEDIMYLYEI